MCLTSSTSPQLPLFQMNEVLSPLWYNYYAIIQQDSPEILDEYIESTAAKLELTVDYFVAEFL
jgi:hypothetical protein